MPLFCRWIIVTELEEPVLARLFSHEWEAGDPSCLNLADIVVATCVDYLGDIQRWLNQMFVSHFLQQLAASTCAHYCMALRRRWVLQVSALADRDRSSTLNRGVFGNGFRVAELIMGDRQAMLKFFGRCERDLEKKPDIQQDEGEYEYELTDRLNGSNVAQSGTFTSELMPMQFLAKIIVASHLSGVQNEVESMFERWGVDGLRLVYCAIMCNTSISSTVKAERQDMLDAAVSLFTKGANRYSREYADEFKYLRDEDSATDLNPLLAQFNQSYSTGLISSTSMNMNTTKKSYW